MPSSNEDYYALGYQAGFKNGMQMAQGSTVTAVEMPLFNQSIPKKKKRKQTGKALILTNMTKPVWDKYKKGSGKKTYFDIRSQVQRSLKYKKKTKGM